MSKGKAPKALPKLRNGAVEAVGRGYFLVSMTGVLISAALALLTAVAGISRYFFTFELDRCDCVPDDSLCSIGQERLEVDIGWKQFTISSATSASGCLDEFTGDVIGEGLLQNGEAYGNGATAASDAMVALFVSDAVLCLFVYRTLQMSYNGPGSIYSVGLNSVAKLCFLFPVGEAIAFLAFYGRIDGQLGDIDLSLPHVLFDVAIDACKDVWDTTDNDSGLFCADDPWTLEHPGWASMLAMAHIGILFITSVWMNWRSNMVEGILDGSLYKDGKACTPRVVEFENAVGRALATTEDPDYDQNNLIFEKGETGMIRSYPLPSTAKSLKNTAVKLAAKTTATISHQGTDDSEIKVGLSSNLAQSDAENPMHLSSSSGASTLPVPVKQSKVTEKDTSLHKAQSHPTKHGKSATVIDWSAVMGNNSSVGAEQSLPPQSSQVRSLLPANLGAIREDSNEDLVSEASLSARGARVTFGSLPDTV